MIHPSELREDQFVRQLLASATFVPQGELNLGVSGGGDSLGMLVLAIAAGRQTDVIVHHVDHGLRPSSVEDARFVEQLCSEWGVSFRPHTVEVARGANLEARARIARHSVWPQETATAHTADDQAETVLINLMRGAALDGLAGIRPGYRHPVLAIRRHQLFGLCGLAGVEPRTDETNRDLRLVRNRVRHQLLPMMNQIANRDVGPIIARQSRSLREDADLLNALAGDVDVCAVDELRELPRALARRALRHWLRSELGHPPDSATIERVLAVVDLRAKAAEVADVGRVERSGGRLRLVPLEIQPTSEQLAPENRS